LEWRKLLRRFTDVCNAIGYAHSRGVLHRDIKPGNVIVGKHGETLVVDWGLAKAQGKREAGTDADERTLVPSSASGSAETLPGFALGTPAYMSPEQAVGQLDKLGSRGDVYSLGATLYSLLTGKVPFTGDVGDVLQRVQAGRFPRPRTRDPSIDPALEAVCLKAMALRPEDRYATPKALTDDIEQWMAEEPVTAWREPLARRARRWMRRNRTVVTGAAAALLAGVIGLAAVVAVQTKANAKLKDANVKVTQALIETRTAKTATEAALAQSKESLSQAKAVSNFLVESFRSPDPSLDGKKILVVNLLDRAAESLDKEFTGTEATRGAMLNALGETYHGLGLYDKAVATLAKAVSVCVATLGPDHPDTLSCRNNLATAYWSAGRTSEAMVMHEETLRLREAKLGPDHPDTLTIRSNLALDYWRAGSTKKATAMDEETLRLREAKLGPDHPDTLTSRNNLAVDYSAAGRTTEAIAIHEKTLKLWESKLGPDHPDTLKARNCLALAYTEGGRTTEAIRMHRETIKLSESKLGPDHPDTLSCRNNLALAYSQAGQTTEAIAMGEETLKLREAKLSPKGLERNKCYDFSFRSFAALGLMV
jgi:tetratricopeptide (TPR) repeat protein